MATTRSAALAGIGGPSLTAKEVELLAVKLGEATKESFPKGLPQKSPEDPAWAMTHLWKPMAAKVNQDLAADGWRLPPLSGRELQQVTRWVDTWMAGTVWDTDSEAWWRMTLEDTWSAIRRTPVGSLALGVVREALAPRPPKPRTLPPSGSPPPGCPGTARDFPGHPETSGGPLLILARCKDDPGGI